MKMNKDEALALCNLVQGKNQVGSDNIGYLSISEIEGILGNDWLKKLESGNFRTGQKGWDIFLNVKSLSDFVSSTGELAVSHTPASARVVPTPGAIKRRPADGHNIRGLDANEAGNLYMLAEEKGKIDENNIGCVTLGEMVDIAGKNWLEKLQLSKAYLPQKNGMIYFDAQVLSDIASSPASPKEVALLIRNRFGCARKANKFLSDRPYYPNDPQYVEIFQSTVANILGPLWESRLRISGITYSVVDEKNQSQVRFPIDDIVKFCRSELIEVERGEEKRSLS